jgi:hypothetical protein
MIKYFLKKCFCINSVDNDSENMQFFKNEMWWRERAKEAKTIQYPPGLDISQEEVKADTGEEYYSSEIR